MNKYNLYKYTGILSSVNDAMVVWGPLHCTRRYFGSPWDCSGSWVSPLRPTWWRWGRSTSRNCRPKSHWNLVLVLTPRCVFSHLSDWHWSTTHRPPGALTSSDPIWPWGQPIRALISSATVWMTCGVIEINKRWVTFTNPPPWSWHEFIGLR